MDEIQDKVNPELINYIKKRINTLIDTQSAGLLIGFYEIHDLICEFYSLERNLLANGGHPDMESQLASSDLSTNSVLPEIEYNEEAVTKIYEQLCITSELYWNNYEALAYCLNYYYPNTDLIDISDEEIIQKVKDLPNFLEKDLEPPDDISTAIITIWVEIYYN